MAFIGKIRELRSICHAKKSVSESPYKGYQRWKYISNSEEDEGKQSVEQEISL